MLKKKEKDKQLRIERGELIEIPPTEPGRNNKKRRREDRNDNHLDKKRYKKTCKYWKQGRCNAEQNCKFIHDYFQSRPASEMILYKKLLSKTINFEQQSIVQCIHFIVSNNFLQGERKVFPSDAIKTDNVNIVKEKLQDVSGDMMNVEKSEITVKVDNLHDTMIVDKKEIIKESEKV